MVDPTISIPVLWTGGAAEIPFDGIARPFFLKSTHASGQVLMVSGDSSDRAAIREQAERWLSVDYGAERDQPGYRPVPPRLMIEQTITTADGARPNELRFFVFDGKVAVINTVYVENDRIRNGAFHTPDWTRLNWHFTRPVDRAFPKPDRLDDMIALAERVGRGMDHVRVDMYDCGEQFWIGELTVYSWSGFSRFTPDEADLELGSYWRARTPRLRDIIPALFVAPTFAMEERRPSR